MFHKFLMKLNEMGLVAVRREGNRHIKLKSGNEFSTILLFTFFLQFYIQLVKFLKKLKKYI